MYFLFFEVYNLIDLTRFLLYHSSYLFLSFILYFYWYNFLYSTVSILHLYFILNYFIISIIIWSYRRTMHSHPLVNCFILLTISNLILVNLHIILIISSFEYSLWYTTLMKSFIITIILLINYFTF